MRNHVNSTLLGLAADIGVNSESIQGRGGTKYPRLCAQLVLKLSEQNDYGKDQIQGISFGMLTAELVIENEKIGDALPTLVNHDGMTFHPYIDTLYLNIEVPLDARRLEAIERYRNGKSFNGSIRFRLGATVFGVYHSQEPSDQVGLKSTSQIEGIVGFTVSDTRWREQVLPALGYGKIITIELPAVPIESIQSLKHSYKALEQAQNQFQHGHYDEAVGKCRIALDPFFEMVEKEDEPEKKIPKLKKSWEIRLGESTYRWLDEMLGTIKLAANKPHHTPNSHFDRLGAQMIIMVATALISYASREIDQE